MYTMHNETDSMAKTKIKSKNNALIAAICCVFVAGITLLGVYLFAPGMFSEPKDNVGEPAPNLLIQKDSITDENSHSDIPFQSDNGFTNTPENNLNDTPFQPDNGLVVNPENRPREDVPYDPVTGGRVSGRVNDNGTGQWSTDGGRTWSDTPPKGVPNH